MTEPQTDTSIEALLARPSEGLSGVEVFKIERALLNAVGVMEEAQLYETAAALGKSDPAAAHALLVEQSYDPDFDPAYPMIRVALMAWLVGKMKASEVVETRDLYAEVQADVCAGGPQDRAREAAFRADPGRYLQGAGRSSVRLFRAPGFGMIRLDGVDLPWTYAAAGKVRSDFSELYALVEDGGYQGGVLVGPPEAESEIALPPGYLFLAMDLSTGGRAA